MIDRRRLKLDGSAYQILAIKYSTNVRRSDHSAHDQLVPSMPTTALSHSLVAGTLCCSAYVARPTTYATVSCEHSADRSVFNQNVTTLRSGICYRISVCLSSNVRAPALLSRLKFSQCFYAILYLSHPLTSVQILRRSSQGNPYVEG